MLGNLAHEIDRAARGTAAGIGRTRTFHDFHLFQVERISRLRAEVAHAVNEDVVARTETAQRQIVARGSAAFAGGHR